MSRTSVRELRFTSVQFISPTFSVNTPERHVRNDFISAVNPALEAKTNEAEVTFFQTRFASKSRHLWPEAVHIDPVTRLKA